MPKTAAELHDPRIERDLLGCLLVEPRCFAHVGDLAATDWFVPAYRAAFEVIAELVSRGKAVDPLTVGDVLARNERSTLLRLREETLLDIAREAPIAIPQHVREWSAILVRESARRRFHAACAGMAARVLDEESVSDLAHELRTQLAEIEDASGGGGPRHVGKAVDEIVDDAAEGKPDTEGYTLDTGIGAFDEKIGGFRAGQLIVVAARPGVGKTALAGTVALHNAAAGVPSLVFTLEMTFREMAERFIGADARFPVWKLSRRVASKPELKTVAANTMRLKGAPLWVDDRVLTAGQTASAARSWRLRAESPKALIVVDYLGLLKPSGRSESRNLEVGRMAWAMKLLAKELKCPVVLVAQLNRASEKEGREPHLSDLRDSGEVEQHANMVIFPHRASALEGNGPASLIVAKNRGGVTGKVDAYWHAEEMRYADVPGSKWERGPVEHWSEARG